MSKLRKNYFWNFGARCAVLLVCAVLYFVRPQSFDIVEGWNFFKGFSAFHILWLAWVVDMIAQIIPIKNKVALGSQKLFKNRFRPVREKINPKALHKYVVNTTKAAYLVFAIWMAGLALVGFLYFKSIIGKKELFMMTVIFYVCDLICVLFWCPFRLIMKTRCCTTCRIYNWDHMMMFSPFIFICGFYAMSIWIIALVAFVVWELCVMIYPERFWEMTNESLKCSECTDKLCTQYCKKLR